MFFKLSKGTRAALGSPLRGSWTLGLLWKVRDRLQQSEIRDLEQRLREFEPTPELTLTGPRAAATPEQRSQQLADIWSGCSLLLDRLCRENDIAYFHFLQPNQYVAGSKPLSAAELDGAYDPKHFYGRWVPSGYPRLQAAAPALVEQGVRFHDLTTLFEGLEETLYVDDCCHVNERGNELIAREIARVILASSR